MARELGLLTFSFLGGESDSKELIAGSWCELNFGGRRILKFVGSYSLICGDGMTMAGLFLFSTELFYRLNRFSWL